MALTVALSGNIRASEMKMGGAPSFQCDLDHLANVHDIPDLPVWGPYSKAYAGISHIPDLKSGMRFDVSVFAALYPGEVLIPDVRSASGCYPWYANSNLTEVSYRYEMEWKDRVYVDATYSMGDSNTVRLALKCVNQTLSSQSLGLNLIDSVNYPEKNPTVRAKTSAGSQWINAVDYQGLVFAHPRRDDNLVPDGWMRGEVRASDYADGRAIGHGFGRDAGDRASYQIAVGPKVLSGELLLRYRMKKGARVSFRLTGLVGDKTVLQGTGNFELLGVPFAAKTGGQHPLVFESEGGAEVEFNGFFVHPTGTDKDRILPAGKAVVPEVVFSTEQSVILKYQDLGCCYGLAWDSVQRLSRSVANDEREAFFRQKLQADAASPGAGGGKPDCHHVFLWPLELVPGSEQTIHVLICNGSPDEVKQKLACFSRSPAGDDARANPRENENEGILPEGQENIFSQKMMRATLLGNVVYPIYTQGRFIRHFTPGKWWNSLYTWDSGFIALGLLEVNPTFAVECLNAYTTPPGSQSAFIEHGSMVPVQIFAGWDLWNRTQSKVLLAYFYPRLKQYYEFVCGRANGSRTRALPSDLLKTWDYFYNSGGWDDYPPQVAVHAQHLENSTTPVITTAQCIRAAKMLRMFAKVLALPKDVSVYDQDIKAFSAALEKYSWDQQSGYFSYVVHDSFGTPSGILTYKHTGVNYNEGLDGAYPLLSGICTPQQQDILLDKIFSPTNMWTPSGICVVDQSAPYFRNDGYWNGAVWMPHQWFMWKTMLDLGRPDLAWEIAQKGLEVWRTETDKSYCTYEHFIADSGQGAGWHQFSALSAPVLSWFAAYYRQGTATFGFEILVQEQEFAPDDSGYKAQLMVDDATQPHPRSCLVCLNPHYNFQATFNGQKLKIDSPYPGLLEIQLPASAEPGELVVSPL